MSGWARDVLSSNVQTVAYDPDTREMTVTFKRGNVYVYSNVDEEDAAGLANAPSVTQALNMDIKGRYSHRRLR